MPDNPSNRSYAMASNMIADRGLDEVFWMAATLNETKNKPSCYERIAERFQFSKGRVSQVVSGIIVWRATFAPGAQMAIDEELERVAKQLARQEGDAENYKDVELVFIPGMCHETAKRQDAQRTESTVRAGLADELLF